MLNLFLDSQKLNRSTRAKVGFAVTTVFGLTTWIWALVLQAKYIGNSPVSLKQLSFDYPPGFFLIKVACQGFDWTDNGGAAGFVLQLFWYQWNQGLQSYLYWIIPAFSDDLQT